MTGRQPGLLGCSPSRNRMLGSGVGGVDQGDRRHRDSELWVTGIVPHPKRELVASPVDDNSFPPTVNQALMVEDKVPRFDSVPSSG
jgi:hypothetical protein